MTDSLDRMMGLWLEPLEQRVDAATDFRAVYADPVSVNGVPQTADDMVARARAVQNTFSDLAIDVVHHIQVPGRIVVAFVMRGRQEGPLQTPLGTVEATGRTVENRVTDILTMVDGKVTDIWMMSDELSLLRQLDAVTLADPAPAG